MFDWHLWTRSATTAAADTSTGILCRTGVAGAGGVHYWFGFSSQQLLTLTKYLQQLCRAYGGGGGGDNSNDDTKPTSTKTTKMSSSTEDDVKDEAEVAVHVPLKIRTHSVVGSSSDSDDYTTEVAGALVDVEGFCYADYRLEQYAHSVLDFSSQYGIDLSISYTAPNITGRPSKYPEYGDFPQTFAMVGSQVVVLS